MIGFGVELTALHVVDGGASDGSDLCHFYAGATAVQGIYTCTIHQIIGLLRHERAECHGVDIAAALPTRRRWLYR